MMSVLRTLFLPIVFALAGCNQHRDDLQMKGKDHYRTDQISQTFPSVENATFSENIRSLLTVPVFTCTTVEGHTVAFTKNETGIWMATVTEYLLPNNSYELLVYCAPSRSVEALSTSSQEDQNRLLHIDTTSHGQKIIYIGDVGLLGGGGGVSTCSDDMFDIPSSIALTAENQIGSRDWAYNNSRGFFGAGTHKCNLFVAEVIAAVGARGSVPSSDSGFRRLLQRPPLAREWASNMYIHNWELVNDPRRGDVVAEDYNREEGDGYSGHVGIVVSGGSSGESVSASSQENCVVRSSFGFRHHENPKFRRYTGSQYALIDSLTNGNW